MKKKTPTPGTAVLHDITALGYNSFCFPSKITDDGKNEHFAVLTTKYKNTRYFLVLPVQYDSGAKENLDRGEFPAIDTKEALHSATLEKTGMEVDFSTSQVIISGHKDLFSRTRTKYASTLRLHDVYTPPEFKKNDFMPEKYGAPVWLPIQQFPHLITDDTQEVLRWYLRKKGTA